MRNLVRARHKHSINLRNGQSLHDENQKFLCAIFWKSITFHHGYDVIIPSRMKLKKHPTAEIMKQPQLKRTRVKVKVRKGHG